MNLFANVSEKYRGIVVYAVLGLALLMVVPAFAEPRPVPSNRFLFIIDTSASMKPLETPVREALFDLIYSGARGRMTNNDTYGIWMVSDLNDTSFPMETWRLKNNVELAATAVTAVKKHGAKGKARLDAAMSDLAQVIKNVDYLTVVLVSNGETPIRGTPFDQEINTRFRELAPDMKRAKATLNLALVAQDGEYVAWAVNSPDFLIEIPFVLPKPRLVAVVEKPAPAPVSNTVRAAAAPVPVQRIASSSIIITKESVAQERRSYVTAATIPDATHPPSNPAPAMVTAPATNAPVAVIPVPAAHPIQTASVQTVTAPLVTNSPMAQLPATAPEVPKVSEPVPVTPPAVSIQVSASNSTLWWALTGGSVTLACVFGLMLLFRRRREPSLISQSLMRERVKVG